VAEKPRNLLPHEFLTSPNLQNAVGVFSWGKFAGDVDLGELVKDLREEVKKVVQNGDMKPAFFLFLVFLVFFRVPPPQWLNYETQIREIYGH